MMHTLDIDKMGEIFVASDKPSPIDLVVEVGGNGMPNKKFFLPSDTEDLVGYLFDVSMSKTIDHAFKYRMSCNGGLYGYNFYLVDSKDGCTNITPEFVDFMSKCCTLKKVFGK